jgi:hypothetical protein
MSNAGLARLFVPPIPISREVCFYRKAAAYWMPRWSLSSGRRRRDPVAEHDREVAFSIAP